MANVRHELPRGHWVETRDPWDVLERDAKEFRKGLPKAEQSSPAGGLAGVPPQLAAQAADDDADDELVRRRGVYTIAWTITDWGGEKLDGKPRDEATIDELPLPLSRAISNVVSAFWREVRGEDFPAGTP